MPSHGVDSAGLRVRESPPPSAAGDVILRPVRAPTCLSACGTLVLLCSGGVVDQRSAAAQTTFPTEKLRSPTEASAASARAVVRCAGIEQHAHSRTRLPSQRLNLVCCSGCRPGVEHMANRALLSCCKGLPLIGGADLSTLRSGRMLHELTGLWRIQDLVIP